VLCVLRLIWEDPIKGRAWKGLIARLGNRNELNITLQSPPTTLKLLKWMLLVLSETILRRHVRHQGRRFSGPAYTRSDSDSEETRNVNLSCVTYPSGPANKVSPAD
jgi:hypothetical protein